MVPKMFTSASKSGSLTERRTSIWAAWWHRASGTNSSKTPVHPLRMSVS